MSEKERIEKIMQMEGLNSGQFAQEIGIQTSTLSHILNGRNKPSLDVMKKILNRYPKIESDWLILGQGAMLRKELQSQSPTLFDYNDENFSKSDSYEPNERLEKEQESHFIRKKDLPGDTVSSASLEKERPEMPDYSAGETDGLFKKDKSVMPTTKQEKKVTKIILYYSDKTFQEFDSE